MAHGLKLIVVHKFTHTHISNACMLMPSTRNLSSMLVLKFHQYCRGHDNRG